MTTEKKKKIIRITTVPSSLNGLLKDQSKFMSQYYDIVGVSSKGMKDLLNRVGKDQGIRVHNIEMTRTISPFKDLRALYKLYKLLKVEKPFIVHSHTPKAGTIGMIAAKLARVPNRLHTIAGLPLVEATGFKRFILNNVERVTYKCATKIYPNSFGLKNIILENRFTTKSKLKVIGNGSSNGIKTEHFNPDLYDDSFKSSFKKELGIGEDDFVFVFIGRLVKDKGINELVEAFTKMASNFDNIKLLLVGYYEEQLDPLLPQTIKAIRESENIIETGHVKDVRPYFAVSNALAFPSYREGFPNVVMQACAMELVSIVTDINGCNEIVNDGETGYIIPKKDTEALYKAMVHVLKNNGQTSEMTEKARQNIVDKYDQKIVWKAILEEYNKL